MITIIVTTTTLTESSSSSSSSSFLPSEYCPSSPSLLCPARPPRMSRMLEAFAFFLSARSHVSRAQSETWSRSTRR